MDSYFLPPQAVETTSAMTLTRNSHFTTQQPSRTLLECFLSKMLPSFTSNSLWDQPWPEVTAGRGGKWLQAGWKWMQLSHSKSEPRTARWPPEPPSEQGCFSSTEWFTEWFSMKLNCRGSTQTSSEVSERSPHGSKHAVRTGNWFTKRGLVRYNTFWKYIGGTGRWMSEGSGLVWAKMYKQCSVLNRLGHTGWTLGCQHFKLGRKKFAVICLKSLCTYTFLVNLEKALYVE